VRPFWTRTSFALFRSWVSFVAYRWPGQTVSPFFFSYGLVFLFVPARFSLIFYCSVSTSWFGQMVFWTDGDSSFWLVFRLTSSVNPLLFIYRRGSRSTVFPPLPPPLCVPGGGEVFLGCIRVNFFLFQFLSVSPNSCLLE